MTAGPLRSRTGVRAALSHRFTVATSDADLGAWLDEVLGGLDVPAVGSGPERPLLRYTIVERAGRGWELEVGGRLVGSDADPSRVVALLLWDVNRRAVERTEGLVLLHAAAAERDGTGVVLPGAMEAGKTTLVAGLVRAGLGYLSDELCAYDPASGRVLAYPKALSLDPGSWPLLGELRPRVAEAARRFVPGQWQVPPNAIRPGAARADAAPRLVILPRYTPGARTRLRPLARPDALVAVASCAFGLAAAPRATLTALAALLRGCTTYELEHADLDAAVQAVLDALDRLDRPDTPDPRGRTARRPARPPDPLPDPGATMTRADGPTRGAGVRVEDITLAYAPRRRDDVTGVELDGEAVLYAGGETMHKLDPLATLLWDSFDGTVTLAELVDDFDAVYPDTDAARIAEDVLACVRDLGRRGLLDDVAADETEASGAGPGRTD